ncbi:MAG: hypothetical protein V2I56_22285 [Desulfobacteraceae bacterium]|jgi:hypothetical protein|nr:hypothetical protein [Desulfobacteraceae bacterium]
MKILHILRAEPDATIKDMVAASTNGDQSKTTELYSGDIDWSRLVDEIFSYDKVICWW